MSARKMGFAVRSILSFITLLVFWMVGHVLAVSMEGLPALFSLIPYSGQTILLLGMGALYFSTLFFGRTAFIFFFVLGALSTPYLTYYNLGLIIVSGMALAAFGTLGSLLGHMISNDLQDREKLDSLHPAIVSLLVLSLVLSVGFSMLTTPITNFNTHAIDVLREFRDGELSFFELLAQLAEVDWQTLNSPPPDAGWNSAFEESN